MTHSFMSRLLEAIMLLNGNFHENWRFEFLASNRQLKISWTYKNVCYNQAEVIKCLNKLSNRLVLTNSNWTKWWYKNNWFTTKSFNWTNLKRDMHIHKRRSWNTRYKLRLYFPFILLSFQAFIIRLQRTNWMVDTRTCIFCVILFTAARTTTTEIILLKNFWIWFWHPLCKLKLFRNRELR